ncbi:MAG: hypothetical protein NTW86_08490, partial [Candidatus Sumerlaeota bacterium]|nr:hypothetical protein [Candidatus Sumerlaeota bacterium]
CDERAGRGGLLMVFKGHVRNGVVVLDESADLPEGVEVRVEPVERKTLADRLRNVIGSVPDLPEDLADNHDHYIHGTPKQ